MTDRFRVIRYLAIFLNSHLHISHGLADVTGGSFRKLFTVCEIKRLGYPALKKVVSIVSASLSKSEEMHLTLWSAPVTQFLFHLVGISDFQCVGSFPGFL